VYYKVLIVQGIQVVGSGDNLAVKYRKKSPTQTFPTRDGFRKAEDKNQLREGKAARKTRCGVLT
jgi:hypothetical protein